MPRITRYEQSVGPAETTRARFDAAPSRAGEIVGASVARLGATVGEAGEDLINAIDDAGAKRMDNAADPRIRAVLYEGQDAYFSKQGFAAVEGLEPAKAALGTIREDLLKQAGNRTQRTMFARSFDARVAAEQTRMAQYAGQQGLVEKGRQSVSRQGNMARNAIDAADDTERYDNFVATGLTEIEEQGRLNGWGPSVVQERQAEYRSSIRTQIADAKSTDDPIGAAAYYHKHQAEFLPKDRLAIERSLRGPLLERGGEVDYATAAANVARVSEPAQAAVPAGQVPDIHRMVAITLSSESANRDYGSDGKVLTSPKGAQGRMQVMPGTQRDPGYGVRPAKDNSVEEMARVGRDYLAVMVKRYPGDPARAWAAYNAGPGGPGIKRGLYYAEQRARAAGRPDEWLIFMPAETQAYVKKNIGLLGGGVSLATANYRPSMDDQAAIYAYIQKQDWPYDRRQAALAAADRHASRNRMLLENQQTRAYDEAYRMANSLGAGFTSVNQIPGSLRQTMGPEQLRSLTSQAEQNARPTPIEANGDSAVALELMAINEPEQFARFDLRTIQPFVTRAEFAGLAADQARLRNAPEPQRKTANLRGEIHTAISFHGADIELGDLAKRKDKKSQQQYLRISTAMRSYIERATDGGKRAVTDDDLKNAFDSAVMPVIERGGGTFGGDVQRRRYEVEGGNVGIPIPPEVHARIVGALRRNGERSPTPQQVSELYLQNKGRPGFWQ